MDEAFLKLKQEDYFMPSEWQRHKATWLTWPHDEKHWPGLFKNIPSTWAKMVKALQNSEEVHISIHDEDTLKNAKQNLMKEDASLSNVHFHFIPNNYSWARDHGPIFLKNKTNQKIISHWQYNAWGNKWPFDLDQNIPSHIANLTNIKEVKLPMVLEGGSIDVNGQGTLLSTQSCLLNKNRNPALKQSQIEDNLKAALGISCIIWLKDGIEGDDTDGHIDDITRFVNENTILTMIEPNRNDKNHKPLAQNLNILKKSRLQNGQSPNIIELCMPKALIHDGFRLPASYANFYIANKVILLPVFNDPNDQHAVDTLEKIFPERKIVAIDARELVWGLGAFHCITQQEPL